MMSLAELTKIRVEANIGPCVVREFGENCRTVMFKSGPACASWCYDIRELPFPSSAEIDRRIAKAITDHQEFRDEP